MRRFRKRLKEFVDMRSVVEKPRYGERSPWRVERGLAFDPINVAYSKVSADGCFVTTSQAFADVLLFVDDKPAGTLLKPNVELLQSVAKPALFGRSDETVYDEQVRKALEIEGSRISLRRAGWKGQLVE